MGWGNSALLYLEINTMFTTEYAFNELRKIDKLLSDFQSKEYIDVHQEEYIAHLKRIRTAYETELEAAKKRNYSDDVDALDYIRKYFPRDGRFV